MSKYTYLEIASNRQLWNEYVDPGGLTTDEQWESETVEDRIAFIKQCFGDE